MIELWTEFETCCWNLLQYSQEICDLIVRMDQLPHESFLNYSKGNLADIVCNVLHVKEEIAKLLQRELEKQNGNRKKETI